jgi:ABC-type nitrate/sulfonate/bicarbonate transport system substrate-binding protein
MLSRRSPSSRTVNLWLALFIAAVAIQTPSSAADKVRIGYTSPTPNHGVLWVADTSHLFKRNNLDLEILYMPGNISLPSLLSGEIQFAQMTARSCLRRAFRARTR